jgi:hypothetical protein
MFTKFINWLSALAKDKILHDDVSCTISLIAACICRLLISKEWYIIFAFAWIIGFIFAIGKEIYDEWKYKGSDEKDWAADIVGITRGSLFSLILTI